MLSRLPGWCRIVAPSFLPLLVVHLGLLLTYDLAGRLAATLTLLGLGSVALWAAVRRLPSVSIGAGLPLVAGAVILRLILVPLPPTLSDDALRYVWDGRVAAAGFNPYALDPDASELRPLRNQAWHKLPHRDVPTVYPPLALSLFAVAAGFPAPLVVLKLALIVADAVTCWLLLVLADARNADRRNVLWYAWNPLVAVEVAGMAHVDALGVTAAVTVAMLLTTRSGVGAAAATAAAAVLTKVVPIVAWPVWTAASRRPWVFLCAGLALLMVAGIPVLAATGGVPVGYLRFGVSWEFNGPLYEPLWRLLAYLELERYLELALDATKSATGAHDLVNRLYPYNYPQFTARLLLVIVSVPFFVRAWRDRDLCRATRRSFGVLLVFSPTVYPWYLLWILPWAALDRCQAWLLLTALMPLCYLPQFSSLRLFPWVYGAIWLPFLAARFMENRWLRA